MRLLILRPRLIGDVVLTTPAVAALRRRYPDAELLYLVETLAAPVVAANPNLDEVLAVPHRRGWRRVADDARLAAALRSRRIDVAVDFHGGPRSAWLTWATRAPVRVGYDNPGRRWMYTRLVHRARDYTPRHSVLNQWDLLRAVDPGFDAPPDPSADRVEMPVDPAARDAVAARLAALGVPPGAPLVVMHVSARNPFRRWPESSFAEVGRALAAGKPPRWLLVTGGPSDADAAARVIALARERAGADAGRIAPAEGWSLAELRAVMDRAALFVGGDSGPMHIAATSDVPIVALYGPTLPAHWAPWRPAALPFRAVEPGPLPCRPCDQRACAPGDFRCLSGISPAAVTGAARALLEARAC